LSQVEPFWHFAMTDEGGGVVCSVMNMDHVC